MSFDMKAGPISLESYVAISKLHGKRENNFLLLKWFGTRRGQELGKRSAE